MFILGMLVSTNSGHPEGYEDDGGFHYGSDPRRRLK